MADWYLYMVRCADASLYTGITTDIGRRFAQHQAGGNRCARYLRGKAPLALVCALRVGTRSQALKLEYRIKRLPKARKERIVSVFLHRGNGAAAFIAG